ncbi:MAG TPA: class D beta-lactamase [Burkholderiales bacterium]
MKRLFAALPLLLMLPCHALEWRDSPEIGRLFEQAGAEGTFVVLDVAQQRLIGHDRARAVRRFVPASTFKIPNTLIGLTVGAVGDVDEVLPYGGKPQPVKDWERDMSLREAVRVSNVPVYQELARRIGLERMRDGVARLEYGNARIGSIVDSFWLRGPLAISAVEQVQFLAKLAAGALPFPREAQARVREIIRLEAHEGAVLYGKTGWGNGDPGIGWWVGWVEKDGRAYPFALNMDIRDASDAAKRVALGKASLRALRVY